MFLAEALQRKAVKFDSGPLGGSTVLALKSRKWGGRRPHPGLTVGTALGDQLGYGCRRCRRFRALPELYDSVDL
jgi:hypothetical protein